MTARIRIIITFVVLAGIAVMTVMNFGFAAGPVKAMLKGEKSFSEMTEEIASGYTSDDFWRKNDFIDLNGLYGRLNARREYNDTTLLNNGTLTYGSDKGNKRNTDKLCKNVTKLAAFLDERDTDFMFVAAPYKVDMAGELLPNGFEDHHNDNMNELTEGLADNGVHTLDLRTGMAVTPAQTEEYFYRTDHHWNTDGAFRGFQMIMSELKSSFIKDLDTSYTDIGLWERKTKENWMLGSQGKRVGRLFGGTDDLIWYEPAFETEMSCAVPHHNEIFCGDFSDANIRRKYIDERDLYNNDSYCVYIGGNYPVVLHRNADAPNKKKVLLIKDSYMIPLEAFLSTEFTEIDAIDPRHYSATTIAEYCAWSEPDLVIMMINASQIGSKDYYNLGLSKSVKEDKKELLSGLDLNVTSGGEDRDHETIDAELKPGNAYRISIGDISSSSGTEKGASVVLYDLKKKKIRDSVIFDTQYSGGTGRYEWSFKIPDEENAEGRYELRVYAGVFGSGESAGMTYSDVSLYQYE